MSSPNADNGAGLVNGLISGFYKTATGLAPDRIAEREFGVGNFDVKISQRHMSFRNEHDLRGYLSANAIPYVSSSSAYYKFPTGRPMERKGWMGSELVFDLDVTDMDLPCQIKHGKSWVCSVCLEEIKKETIKLVYDFLVADFGFSEKEIDVNFSGNRGYHVHVKNKDVLMLDAAARKQVTEYISGVGIDFDKFFMQTSNIWDKETYNMKKMKMVTGPNPKEKGWGGKIARNFISSLDAGPSALERMDIDAETAKKLYRNKILIERGIGAGSWDFGRGISVKKMVEMCRKMVQNQAIVQSDRIDRNVTNDPTHLLRLPNSIHGGTGLIARKLAAPKELYRFDPLSEGIAFRKGFVKINANTGYELRMAGQKFGPYAGEIKVPTYVGVYLYLRGLAKIINFI